jgi:transcriptional regulator with XRE-family HTH domain
MVTNGANKYIKESERIRHYRGLYSRVAKQLGVDRSFVSRVANGERQSESVQRALAREIERIDKMLRTSSEAPKKNKAARKSSASRKRRG